MMWIDVKAELPNPGQCVDVWVKICGGYHNGDEARFTNAFYDHHGDYWWHWDAYGMEEEKLTGLDITHWMPPPEPPQ